MSISTVNNEFGRVAANIEKMGAYYTDINHCKSIFGMFQWPESEVSVIEPSVGDGSAVIAATGADSNPNIKIFGVELNNEVADKLKNNPLITEVLKADFLTDVRIKNQAFSFCFGNPPYIDNTVTKEGRQELTFLQKIVNYLQKDGICVWVIPYRVFAEDQYMRYWMSRFETLAIYKFREPEFSKFGQCVLIGRRRNVSMFSTTQMAEFRAKYTPIDKLEELPVVYEGDKFEVLPSNSDDVTLFATLEFDAELAYDTLRTKGSELDGVFNRYVTTPPFVVNNIGRPPIPLKKDSMYLLTVSGGGQGLAGTDGVDLHLQRGIAEVVEESMSELDDSDKKTVERVQTRTQIKMAVIQQDGTISRLV